MNDRFSGFVDLGSAGLGDPRNDLVLALWSLEFNYGAGWGETLLQAYGVGSEGAAEREKPFAPQSSASAGAGR
jgi:aminoglycoside phosphotransferase